MIDRIMIVAGALLAASSAAAQEPQMPAAATLPAQAQDDGRIIGGTPAALGKFKYQVEILWKTPPDGDAPVYLRAHRCGGALVSPDARPTETRWVLTAAHCLYSGERWNPANIAPKMAVRAGFLLLADTSVPLYDVDAAIPHPGFIVPAANRGGRRAAPVGGGNAQGAYLLDYTNDLALLRLAQPIPIGANVNVIRLGVSPTSGSVIVTGWGVTDRPGDDASTRGVSTHRLSSPQLMSVPLTVIACERRGEAELPPTHFCAGDPGKDSCLGDSGGPAVIADIRPMLVGVVSRRPFGQDTCGGASVQTRYAKLDPLIIDWINRTMAARASR